MIRKRINSRDFETLKNKKNLNINLASPQNTNDKELYLILRNIREVYDHIHKNIEYEIDYEPLLDKLLDLVVDLDPAPVEHIPIERQYIFLIVDDYHHSEYGLDWSAPPTLSFDLADDPININIQGMTLAEVFLGSVEYEILETPDHASSFNIINVKHDEYVWRNIHKKLVNENLVEFFLMGRYLHAASLALNILKHYVEKTVNDTSKKNSSEADYMAMIFNESNPIIKINDLITITQQSEQRGFRELMKGVFVKYRNKYAHNQSAKIDKEECVNLLFMITEYLDVIDNIPMQENTASEKKTA